MSTASLIKSKLPHFGTSIFAEMSALARQHDAINLSQGFPDFASDPVLIELVSKYMKEGFNQYAPMPGAVELRESIASKLSASDTAVDPDREITVTAGATQAIFTAIMALVHEGDEVVIFTPAYDCYAPAVELAGGKPVFVQLEFPDYSINWKSVEKMIGSKTRMIIINTPHNPSGSALSQTDIEALERITKDSKIIVLSDEVYEHIIFDGLAHVHALASSKLRERTMAVYSFGKTFHNTGWKLGYCVGPDSLMQEFRKVHQFNVFACNTPMQMALAEYMHTPENYLSLASFYQEKRDVFAQAIAASRFKLLPCSGTYFQLLSYEDISDQPDKDFAVQLTQENGIASIPVSVFYHKKVDNRVLRFCFAKSLETLEKAAEVLCKI